MFKFKVLSGSHQDETGKVFKPGEIVTTARNLVASFGEEKFELVSGAAAKVINIEPAKPATPPNPPASPNAEQEPENKGQGQENGEDEPPAGDEGGEEALKHPDSTGRSELGEDVTKAFPIAVENEFKVFKGTGGWHYVTEPEAPKKALNTKALKASGVEAFIKTLLK